MIILLALTVSLKVLMTGTQLCSGPPELEQKQWRYIDMPNLGLYCTAKSIN